MMVSAIDETHDPALRSWVQSANGHTAFPLQNLPFGVFRPHSHAEARGGVAIGDSILDLRRLAAARILSGAAQGACEVAAQPALNDFLALGSGPRRALRHALSRLLAVDQPSRHGLLHDASACDLLLPARIGDYTDFYAGIHHAQHVGELFRPEMPLVPAYKWLPIAYHGRASSIRPSGVPVRRPRGQRMLSAAGTAPTFEPTRALDFELELAIWIGSGNELGVPISMAEAPAHIAGYSLLNDWSARDVQSWEYHPLGPFLGKSFHTTVSPWIVTPEALAPFRLAQPPRDAYDPQPLPYLHDAADQSNGALGLSLTVSLLTPRMRAAGDAPHTLTQTEARQLYWTPAQMLAHQTSNGCNVMAGDLLGTGTISSATAPGLGCLLEMNRAARERIALANGETRTYLEDGDEVLLTAAASRENFVSIGFGECRALILPATE